MDYLGFRKEGFVDCCLTSNFDERYYEAFPNISTNLLFDAVLRYPKNNYPETIALIKETFEIRSDILLSSGAEDSISRLNNYFSFSNFKVSIVIPIFYRIAETLGKDKVDSISEEDFLCGNFESDVLWLQNPNLFSGKTLEREGLIEIIKCHPKVLFVVDEAGMFTLLDWKKRTLLNTSLDILIVLSSFSKIYGLSGMRVGFLCAQDKTIENLKKSWPTFPVTTLAELFISSLITNMDIVDSIRYVIFEHKKEIENMLKKSNVPYLDTLTNCVFVKNDTVNFFDELLLCGISTFELQIGATDDSTYTRITIHSSDGVHAKLMQSLQKILYEK